MDCHTRRLGILLGLLLLVGGCSSGEQRTARHLDNRLQSSLASDIAAGNVALQPLAGGAQVTLAGNSLFADDARAQDNKYSDVRANIIEALLDPSLMQIQVADTAMLPDYQRDMRVRNVTNYFIDNGLGATLQPSVPMQTQTPVAAAVPAGLTITISVQCPDRRNRQDYDSGRSTPRCD